MEMDFTMTDAEKASKKKSYMTMKEQCEKFLEVDQREFDIDLEKVFDDSIINIQSTMSDP
jgi:hypothetical protein